MNDAPRATAAPAAAPTTMTGANSSQAWWLPATGRTLERERLEHRAGQTAAAAQLRRCFPRWARMLEQLTPQALTRLAENQPIDPNDPDTWRSRDAHAEAVLRRHRLASINASRLTSTAIECADRRPSAAPTEKRGWTGPTLAGGESELDERLRRAHVELPVNLDDPHVWAYRTDQRRVLASRLGLPRSTGR